MGRFVAVVSFALALVALTVTTAIAQSDYGSRLRSKDGQWYLPLASRILSSSDGDHVSRGSINSWDISATEGSPVWAAYPGIVEAAGCNLYESGQWPIMQGYGCAVSIKHGNGIVSQYGHCKANSIVVKVGNRVDATSQLCQVGWTGKTSFGPHTHFTILRNGSPIRIDSIFDINQMRYCKFCSSSNKPGDPVQGMATGPTTTTQVQATANTRLDRLQSVLRGLNPDKAATIIVGIFALLCVVWWLGGLYERVAVVALVVSSSVVVLALWLTMPIVASQPTTAQVTEAGPTGNAAWEWAYPIIQSNEGWKCTEDGAHTMGGVTQGTYNRWRAKHGMGSADVCGSLTRAQAKAIYYELFWLPIAGNSMPAKLALTAVDHYINTGKVSHLLAQCGNDIACFNKARIADYHTKGNCNLYCRAWENRVNKIRKYTGG